MEMNGAQLIVKLLERQGTQIIWGIPGGATLPLYDALCESPIQHILTRHEQGAGFMAQGMARTTGQAAVCTATSGPGSTNLITALADAHLDSVPLVAITGQVSTTLIGTDAFQEVDTYGLTLPVTKHNFLVKDAHELLTVIPQAFEIAQSGRPGPVVIDVPKDIQTQKIAFDHWPEPGTAVPARCHDSGAVFKMAGMIRRSQKPVFYVGGGVAASGAAPLLRRVAKKNGIPVVSTLMGLGTMAYDDPLFLGMLGMHGTPVANRAMAMADLIIAFGIRFDDRATGKLAAFCREAGIIHVDVDESEIGKIRNASLGLCGDAAAVLSELEPLLDREDRGGWHGEIASIKANTEDMADKIADPLHPCGILRYIGNQAPADTITATDVGQHQMWTAQAYPVKQPRTLLMSGGLGTMGFGIPVAMGAAFANPERKIVCITGDGSFLMNIQELATLSENNLNLTIILMDNGHLGLVRQQQELLCTHVFASRFSRSPDFETIAKGFGIRTFNAGVNGADRGAIDEALAFKGPSLVVVPIDQTANVYPMVPPGASNLEMIQEA